MTLSRRVGQGTLIQLGARLFGAASMFVIGAVVAARVLSASEFGRFAFYLTLFLLTASLADFGANRAAIRMVAAGERSRQDVLRAALVLKTGLGLLAFLVIAAVILLTESTASGRVVLLLAATHALSHGLGGGSVGFEVDLEYRTPATALIGGQAVFLVVGLKLAGGGTDTAPPYLLAWAIGLVVQNLLLFMAARRRHGIAPRLDRETLRRLGRQALPLGVSAVAVSIYFHVDTLLLRPMQGEEEVGRYAAAYRLMAVGLLVPALFGQVVFPVFTRCHQASRALLERVVQRSSFYMALLGSIACALLVCLAAELLELVYGPDYRSAELPLVLLAPALLCIYLCYPLTTALITAGKATTFARITLLAVLVNLVLDLVLIPGYGAEGAALATLATEALVLVAGFSSLRRRVGVSGLSLELLGPALLGLALVLLLQGPLAQRPWFLSVPAALGVGGLGAVLLRAWPFRLGVDEEQLS